MEFSNQLLTLLPKPNLHLPSFNISTVIAITLFFALLCACIVIGHLVEEHRWINESTTSILLGLCSGLVVLLVSRGGNSHILVFSEDLFFIYLLPPIIFNAGFQVKKKRFFRNFSIILLFGVVGTLISFCVISIGNFCPYTCAAIGAIFSATDSVCTLQVLNQDQTPLLYSLVFGEGVVNDATSIVLFNAVQTLDFNNISVAVAFNLLGTFLYLFCTSTILGVAVGLISAYVMKTLYFGRHSTDREVALMMLMAYLSYMVSELLSLSGILTVFFCGIVMSHYTWHNVTESSRITTKHAFATISFIAETFIFLYVGMDALDIDKWKASHASFQTSVAVSSTLFSLVLVGRAAFVFPLATIANWVRSRTRTNIVLRQQLIIWWAGLMRGAVTIALSYNQFTVSGSTLSQDRALMITSTIIVVLFSTVVFGSITKPLIECVLFGRKSDTPQPASLEDIRLLFLDNGGPLDEMGQPILPRGSSIGLLMQYPASTVHYFWRKFDDKYMRPVFGGRGFVPVVPGSPTDPEEGRT
ncbi:Na+/H+ exchanger [Macleaya cordata]|uniref:Na+/H+ exchanger n=1 Tax=Macleaya cordata TaxID=56857 RepID=A0A200RBK4_MACCD|nr:Na+/H+ exchanger [Macleaya cordata]